MSEFNPSAYWDQWVRAWKQSHAVNESYWRDYYLSRPSVLTPATWKEVDSFFARVTTAEGSVYGKPERDKMYRIYLYVTS